LIFLYVSNISTIIISKPKFSMNLHEMFIIFLLHMILLLLSSLRCTLHPVFSLVSSHLESIQRFYRVRGLRSPDTNMPAGHRRPGRKKALKAHPALSLIQEAGAGENNYRVSVVPSGFLSDPTPPMHLGMTFFFFTCSLILTVEVQKKVSPFLACFWTIH
jgi:hypothetical protein